MDPHKPYGGPWPLDLPDYDKGYNGSINFIYGWKEPVNELHEPLTEADLRHVRALYDADILRFDRHFKILLDEMKKQGLLENTIIAFTADHGEEFLEHGDFGHGKNLQATQTHIPLILAGKGVPKNLRLRGRASLVDLPISLCQMASVSPPATFQGQSLLDQTHGFPESAAFSELQFKGRQEFALRFSQEGTNRYSFLENMRSGNEQLFDRNNDPGEKTDISNLKPDVIDDAMAKLRARIHKENQAASVIKKSNPVTLGRDSKHVLQELGYIGN